MKIRLLPLALLATLGGCCCGPLAGDGADESAYLTGTIVSRDDRFEGRPSALVAAAPDEPQDRRRAHIMLDAAPEVRWRDGQPASVVELRIGRVVTVWATGPELRSYPPVATARTVVIER